MIHETDFNSPDAGADARAEAHMNDRDITADAPRPGWVALDAAREQAFTGEIVFRAEPDVRVYLDNGVAYYAERGLLRPVDGRGTPDEVFDAVRRQVPDVA